MHEPSEQSLVDQYPSKNLPTEATYPLSEKKGGGGIKGYIERARQDRDDRQRAENQRRLDRNLPPTEHRGLGTFSEELASRTVLLDSNNLAAEAEAGRLERTSSGLINGVALFGSTHAQANWRESSSIAVLKEQGITNYTPRMDPWIPDLHPKAEALALNEMSVLGMRIENHELKDGSLGSMVEIGMAALSAAINGQRLVISFEENIIDSLEDPGAQAQFIALNEQLLDIQQLFPDLVTVLGSSSLDDFNTELVQAVRFQEKPRTAREPMGPSGFAEHEERKKNKMKIEPLSVTFGGSSGSFSENPDVVSSFHAEQSIIKGPWGGNVTSLNEPPYTFFWDAVKAVPNDKEHRNEKKKKSREAYLSEEGVKRRNAILIWSIQDEAISKAAITEVGFMLLKALKEGQQVMIVMEPFNADLYVRTFLKEHVSKLREQVKAQTELGYEGNKSMNFEEFQKEKENVEQLLTDLENVDSSVSNPDLLSRVKSSHFIKQTRMFADFDNARRTRAVFEAQMAKLVDRMSSRKDVNGKSIKPFFTFATTTEQYLEQAAAIQEEYGLPKAA